MAHYYTLYAWKGGNRTGIGVAFYDDERKLAGYKMDYLEQAIRRGDLPTNIHDLIPYKPSPPPEDEADMEWRVSSTANAMSMLSWTGPLGTTVWTEHDIERTWEWVTGREER